MPQAWYRDESEEDPSLPHMTDPPKFLDILELKKQTGMEFFKVDADNYSKDPNVLHLREKMGLVNEFIFNISHQRPDYKDLLTKISIEHLHKTIELQLVVDGTGYFEVRSIQDKWIRLQLEKGDMFILPRGQYHRLSPTPGNHLVIKRFYKDEPHTIPFKRSDPSTERMDVRKKFLEANQI